MDKISWIHLVYMLGVLLLLAPAIAYTFRAPQALRNAAIWLAIIAGLGWAYKLSDGQLDQFINMPQRYETAPSLSPERYTEDDIAPKKDEPPTEDSPIRNP
mgnify:CR=1 FL=1